MANKSVKRKQTSTSRRTRKPSTSTTSTVSASSARPMTIQREINKDYKILLQDYKRLSRELIKLPVTKYILGGIAITSLVPVVMKLVRKSPKLNTMIRTNVDAIEEKMGAVGDVVNDKIADLRRKDDVNLAEARH